MLTILEASKLIENPLRTSIIETVAAANPVLEVLPFLDIEGTAHQFLREGTLPSVGFRSINEGFAESTGTNIPVIEPLTLFGGDLDIDKFLLKANERNRISVKANQIDMKTKAASLTWLKHWFDGDKTADAEQFNGLNARLATLSAQVINATTGGATLTLNMVDDLIDAVKGQANVIFLNKKMQRKITRLAQSTATVTIGVDALGRRMFEYGGVRLAVVEDDAQNNAILGFDEDDGSGNLDTTSLYACRIGLDSLYGVQLAPLEVRDLGELESKPVERVRLEWYMSFAHADPKSAARLVHVNNA